MKKVLIVFSLLALVLAFAPLSANAATYTLTIASSNPPSGVAITVSPTDTARKGNGTTQFTRTYNSGTVVTLTAPATSGSNAFQKWQKGGVDYATTAKTTVTVSANTTMTAVFATATASYTLTVASSNPTNGVAITVSPNDKSGLGNGTTQFTRTYNSGTAVTLTAPATSGSNAFQKWQKNGVDASSTKAMSVTMTANTTMTAVYGTPPPPPPTSGDYRVVAFNDLGMHCTCPGGETYLLLPPFNTIRAQVFKKGCNDPDIVADGVTVSYAMATKNETDDYLINIDPYFKSYIQYSPMMFPGYQPVVNGKVVSISGAGLAGNMGFDPVKKAWIVTGVPAFPVPTGTSSDIEPDPIDPSQPKRTPYLTANITVTDNATGAVLATTSTVVPVAMGGCCSCHLKLAGQNAYPQTPVGAFQYMGYLHGKGASKIDFSKLDPTGRGVGGPIRCSWCHWDPAMGDQAVAPGLVNVWPNYQILPGAGFTKADVKVSKYSFSDAVHRFHATDNIVLTQYDPGIVKNCYDCHPEPTSVVCYRGVHVAKGVWCTDCHGNLTQRIATNQMAQPWQQSTLPSCDAPSNGISSAIKCHSGYGNNPTPGLFGKFNNSVGHMGGVLCSTCHGSPHALNPSSLAQDNTQLTNLQSSGTFPAGKNASYPLGVCDVCHVGKGSSWGIPKHLSNIFPTFQLTSDDFKHDSFLGKQHENKYKNFGTNCATCHNGTNQQVAPWVGDKRAEMQPSYPCSSCHSNPNEKFVTDLSGGSMNYTRCGDCHKVLGETAWEDYSPTGPLGRSHINMYTNFGVVCKNCHEGKCQPIPPRLADQRINTMKPNHCCSECHPKGGKPDIFISKMPNYCRCTDCHQAP